MVMWLPRDSATMLSVNPPTEYDFWVDYRLGGGAHVPILADIRDVLIGANWQRSGKKGGKPKPVKRPKDLRTKKRERFIGHESAEDFAQWYQSQPGGRKLTQ